MARLLILVPLCLPGLAWPAAVCAQVTAEQAIDNANRVFSIQKCKSAATADEIVVCATDNSRHRLPLRIEPAQIDANGPGEFSRTPVDGQANRPCGVFQGQRRCGIRELRRYGYGGGSVPIRALIMLGKNLVDPESEIGPLGGYPINSGELP